MLNGSGSYTAGDDPVSGDCTAPPYCVAQASPVAWRAFRMAACVCHTGLELRTSGAQHTESPSRLFLPRLGQSAPDLQAAPDYKGSCCEGLRGDGSRRDEERLLLQALNVRWCAGAVERYEARQAAHFCMLKGPIEPIGHADPRQACYAHTCSHVFDPCFLGSAGGLHASGPGLVAAIQAVVLVAAARGVDVRSSRLRRGVGGAARAPGALRQAAPLPTSPMALAVCKPAYPRPNPNR